MSVVAKIQTIRCRTFVADLGLLAIQTTVTVARATGVFHPTPRSRAPKRIISRATEEKAIYT